MSVHKINAEKPANIVGSDKVVALLPTATPLLDDKGNPLPPDVSLETQRDNMVAAEEAAKKADEDAEKDVDVPQEGEPVDPVVVPPKVVVKDKVKAPEPTPKKVDLDVKKDDKK